MHWNAILADTAAPVSSTAQPAAPTASGAQPGQQPPPVSSPNILLFAVPVILILYIMMIRPQQQQAKQQAKLLAAIKSGDTVITSSGIKGVIITVKDKTVTLRSADAKMEVTKSSINQILESGEETTTTK